MQHGEKHQAGIDGMIEKVSFGIRFSHDYGTSSTISFCTTLLGTPGKAGFPKIAKHGHGRRNSFLFQVDGFTFASKEKFYGFR